MYDNRMRLQFMSLSQNESFARAAAGAFLTQLNPTLDQLTDVRTAISEAVTNAVIHGYQNGPGLITLCATIEGGRCTFAVRDSGVGIEDVSRARQPFFTTRPELERSGMGFTVMETFMDEVVVRSSAGGGTTVIMKKIIKGEAKK
ncbi:MAG: anti-sigma F factor [Clostridiales bacterium]|nr:anti-sigma F factor [Clostridiales bacterium]